jgi:hypothetical protein
MPVRYSDLLRAKTAGLFVLMLSLMLIYQALYVRATAPGQWSALFFNGSKFAHPNVPNFGYIYPNSSGYDGQWYRTLELDPLLTKGFTQYLDNARLRSRRILISAIAGALGRESYPASDYWFIAITDITMALGGLCFIRLAKDYCPPLTAAILYLFIPAIPASTDRMVVDGPAVAGFLAVLLFFRERRTVPLMLVLAALPLVRESSLTVTGGVALAYFLAADFKKMLLSAATALPTIAWWIYEALRTPYVDATHLFSIPLVPQALRLFTLIPRPASPLVALALYAIDFVAMACLLIAFVLFGNMMIRELQRARVEGETWIVLPVAVLAAFAGSPEILKDPSGFMRIDSMLIAWAGLQLMRMRLAWAVAYLPASSAGLLMFRVKPLLSLVGVNW